VEQIPTLRVKTQSNPRPSDPRGHVAGFRVFEEERKDLRFEILGVQRPVRDLDH
jgi:hypothetical protein